MEREEFAKVMQEVLDSLPKEFRSRIQNVAVLMEDFPPGQPSSAPASRNVFLVVPINGCDTIHLDAKLHYQINDVLLPMLADPHCL